jgi:hypothetical protein
MFISLGVAVILSFSIMWGPFLSNISVLQQVLSRIFPLRRGLFEDYVANFWYVHKELFDNDVSICLVLESCLLIQVCIFSHL